MKPMGALPAEFRGEGRLVIAGRSAAQWIANAGTPLFVYDVGIVEARIARLRAAMPAGLDLHYAIKANPFAPLIAAMAPLVDGLDIASDGELALALAAKPGKAISFAGPGKSDREIAAAIVAGVTLNLESEGEADRALTVAERLGVAPRLAVRVNPEIELRGSGMRMGGRASPFGIDADRAGALAKRVIEASADWRGFHIFAGSQALDPQAIIETQAETLALAGRLADRRGPALVTRLGAGLAAVSFAVMAFAPALSPQGQLVLIVVSAIGFDFGVQATLIAHQTIVYGLDPGARSRLNALLFTGMFIGMAAGAALGSQALALWGWPGVVGLATAASAAALAVRLRAGG